MIIKKSENEIEDDFYHRLKMYVYACMKPYITLNNKYFCKKKKKLMVEFDSII